MTTKSSNFKQVEFQDAIPVCRNCGEKLTYHSENDENGIWLINGVIYCKPCYKKIERC